VQEKAAVTQGKHDIARLNFFEGAACNLDLVARPKSGEHTLTENAKTNPARQTMANAQSVGY
jgi:hypothetical protein